MEKVIHTLMKILINFIISQSADTSKGGNFITSTDFPVTEASTIIDYGTVQDNIKGNDGITTSIFNNDIAAGVSANYDTTLCGGG